LLLEVRDDLPSSREPNLLRTASGLGHRGGIADIAATPARAWSFQRHASAWAAATLLLTAVGAAVDVIVLIQAADVPADVRGELAALLGYLLTYGVAGAFLISRRPDLPFGWLLAGAAAALTLAVATTGPAHIAVSHGETGALTRWGLAASGLGFVQIAVQGLINVRFPSGKITSRTGRVLDRLMILGLVLVVLGGLFGSTDVGRVVPASSPHVLENPLVGGTPLADVADAMEVGAPLIVLLGIIAGLHVVVRAVRAEGIEREQLRWRAGGVLLSLGLFPFAVAEVLPDVIGIVDGLLFVATLAIPVMFYHLWDIDAVIRRSAVYALVTVVLVSVYLAIAAVGAAVASERAGVLVAALVVAVAVGPARNRSQRLVDHFFYGERDDPYRALSDVSRRLEAVAEPGTVLTAVVTAVAESLRLPYVAIERPVDNQLLAAHGAPGEGPVERWPLTYQGRTVGNLVATPRRGEAAFDPRDRVVLTDLGRQSGAAVHAEALTADLLESRQRLVNMREEERRRLRRDLHDGLGPVLTGLGLNIDAARTQLEQADVALSEADAFLSHAKEASSRAIGDLRSIVYGLRPPALDDLGLVGAVRVHVDRLVEGSPMRITVDAPGLPDLPAAVEVAAFRTAVEAVNNVVRHADARRCGLQFKVEDGSLVLEVADDGSSRLDWTAGVGLLAMRERAAELGGTLTAGATSDGGRVRARFPLGAATTTGSTP
jgi:two-component system NarL family sensor kinase